MKSMGEELKDPTVYKESPHLEVISLGHHLEGSTGEGLHGSPVCRLKVILKTGLYASTVPWIPWPVAIVGHSGMVFIIITLLCCPTESTFSKQIINVIMKYLTLSTMAILGDVIATGAPTQLFMFGS